MSTLDKFLRTAKVLYEDVKNELIGSQRGIDQLLFPRDDFSTSANFTLDRYILDSHGITFRNADEQSKVRPYTPGVGQAYEVPRASEKTPITEQLRDSVVAGVESTAGFTSHNVKMVEDIIRDHVVAHNITRWKLALDVIRTGKFSPKGAGGNDIGLEIDFGRDAGQSITYDFTAAGAKIDTALKEIYDRGNAKNMSKNNRVILLGNDWLSKFETDSDVLKRMQNNPSNVIVETNMMPPELQGVKGLYVIGRYRIPGCVGPVWLTAYSPDSEFTPYKGASKVNFMPDDEAVMFSLEASRFRIFRGTDTFDASGNVIRTVGEIIFDVYAERDPATEFLRSQTRFAMVPGDIDKTVRSTGTFPSPS
jgi:hypothetical protein